MDPLKHLTGTSEIYDFVGNDEYPLRLKIGELRALQTELNSGPSQILSRLQHGEWMVDDVIETIRCALIGGGMSHKDAKRLVTEYVIDGHLMVYQIVALRVLFAFLHGNPEDQAVGETMAPTMTEETLTPDNSFDGELTSNSPEPLDTHPDKSMT